MPLSRRHFLRSTVVGAALASPTLARASNGRAFQEPAQSLAFNHDADVIVCGGAPAGIVAAISAARAGSRVRLFELHGCLGGGWTSGLLTYIFDFDEPGLTRELVRRLDERHARGGGVSQW